MSWFTDIAGKAEHLLNKIDQNAATVLKQTPSNNGDDDDDDDIEEIGLLQSVTIEDASVQQSRPSTGGALKLLVKPTISETNEKVRIGNVTSLLSPLSLPPAGAAKSTASTTSNSRRSSISSKSSRIGGETVIEKSIDLTSAVKLQSMDAKVQRMTGDADSNNELTALKIIINELKSERDDLKCEVLSLVDQLNNESSQSKLKELQEIYNQCRSERDDLSDRFDHMEKSNNNYIKSISELEIKLSKMLQIEADTTTKFEWSKKEVEQVTTEFQQYRVKAQKMLQAKDELIERLKTNKTGNDGNDDIDAAVDSKLLEMDHIKAENSSLIDERNLLARQLEDIRIYVDKLETMHKDQQIEFEKRLNAVNQNLKQDERKWMQFEDDSKAQVKELNAVRDEMSRVQMEFSTKLHDKDVEIKQLKTKLTQKSSIDFSNDLEERVHSLTQSLVQKQNSLESITADRNALRFQLEKIEHQHRTTVMQLRQQRPQIINVNDTDDAKAQLPIFMQENPFDTNVARRVKRAYSSLDSLGVRLGVFLRRYPLIRILAIFYVALLHFWVILVLFSSRPT